MVAARDGVVTSPTIRKRILKRGGTGQGGKRFHGYIAYDPQEDTETQRRPPRAEIEWRYIAYDPQEDTETELQAMLVAPGCGYIAYDPQEDTETAD